MSAPTPSTSLSITQVKILNAKNGAVLKTMTSGGSLYLGDLGTSQISILVETNNMSATKAIRFETGGTINRCDQWGPLFSLTSDNGTKGASYTAFNIYGGLCFSVKMTPHSGTNCSNPGTAVTLNFQVLAGNEPTSSDYFARYELRRASNGTLLRSVSLGETSSLASLGTADVTVLAIPTNSSTVKAVSFQGAGISRCDQWSPQYSITSDNGTAGASYTAFRLNAGQTHSFQMAGFDVASCGGSTKGSGTLTFSVVP